MGGSGAIHFVYHIFTYLSHIAHIAHFFVFKNYVYTYILKTFFFFISVDSHSNIGDLFISLHIVIFDNDSPSSRVADNFVPMSQQSK